jgi:hypothetical protein
LHGQIASLVPATLSSTYDLVGAGRAPRAWPAVIDTRSQGVRRVSFPVPDPTETEQSAIRDYFPESGGGAVPPLDDGGMQSVQQEPAQQSGSG